jgi:hypothetical protein
MWEERKKTGPIARTCLSSLTSMLDNRKKGVQAFFKSTGSQSWKKLAKCDYLILLTITDILWSSTIQSASP